MPLIVDLGEMLEHGRRQFTQYVPEAVVARFIRQSTHEFLLENGVLGAYGPQRDRRSVSGLKRSHQVMGIGMHCAGGSALEHIIEHRAPAAHSTPARAPIILWTAP